MIRIDIDYLCSLNRFRDVRKDVCGTQIVIEPGIIDEMLRQSFDLKRMSIPHKTSFFGKTVQEDNCPGIYDYLSLKNKILAGHYICSSIDSKKDEGVWHNYFISCENKYAKGFYRSTDWEGLKREGLLLGIEKLIMLSEGKLNHLICKFGVEINSIDDFKFVLKNEEVGKEICKYLIGIISKKPNQLADKGIHEEYYSRRKMVDGHYIYITKRIDYLYLDAPLEWSENDEGDKYEKFNEDEETKKGEIEDIVDEEYEEEDGLFKELSDDMKVILTEKQVEYINKTISGEKIDGITKGRYKRNIINSLEEYLNSNRYYKKTSYGYKSMRDLINTLEEILQQDTLKESFIKLCECLQEKNKVAEILIDVVYSLEPRVYEPVVMYINNELDINPYVERYFSSEFINIINALQQEYNFQIDNKIQIYNYNKSESERKESKFINWMKKEIFKGNDVTFVSGDKTEIYGYKDDITKRYDEVFNEKLAFKYIMQKFNISMKKSSRRIDGETVRGYNITLIQI